MYVRKRAEERIAREQVMFKRRRGAISRPASSIPTSIRWDGQLGVPGIYRIFDAEPQVAADRAFLPDRDERQAMGARGERLLSFEQGRTLSDFDILAFSISFETDYLNVLSILAWPGFRLRRRSVATITIR